MAEADRSNAEKTLRDGQRELSRKAGEFQDDASTRKNEELGKVQRYLVQEIQNYSNTQGFDLVLGDVFYAKQPLDITAAVLAVLQTKPATIPAAPPPAKAAPAPAKPPGSK
jgi:Skp family chaperone for outer membrane proteins